MAGPFVWTTAQVLLYVSMYIVIIYCSIPLSEQPYFVVSVIVLASPLVDLICYGIRKCGKIREELPAHLEFAYKGGPLTGFLQALSLMLILFSSLPERNTPDFQAVAIQLTLPATMLFSVMLLRFPACCQFICALVAMGGLGVSIAPNFTEDSNFIGIPFWMSCFVIGYALKGLSAVIMEHSMKNKEHTVVVDGFVAAFITGIWTAIFFFALLPLNFWPWFSQINKEEFWDLMKEAYTCTIHGYDSENLANSENCNNLWILLTVLVVAVALWNAVVAEMQARFSANYTQSANCLGGVLALFYYNIKPIAKELYQPFSWYTVMAVALIVLATGGYRIFDPNKDENQYAQMEPKSTKLSCLMISLPKNQGDIQQDEPLFGIQNSYVTPAQWQLASLVLMNYNVLK